MNCPPKKANRFCVTVKIASSIILFSRNLNKSWHKQITTRYWHNKTADSKYKKSFIRNVDKSLKSQTDSQTRLFNFCTVLYCSEMYCSVLDVMTLSRENSCVHLPQDKKWPAHKKTNQGEIKNGEIISNVQNSARENLLN